MFEIDHFWRVRTSSMSFSRLSYHQDILERVIRNALLTFEETQRTDVPVTFSGTARSDTRDNVARWTNAVISGTRLALGINCVGHEFLKKID
jgi:hypothetical protein